MDAAAGRMGFAPWKSRAGDWLPMPMVVARRIKDRAALKVAHMTVLARAGSCRCHYDLYR